VQSNMPPQPGREKEGKTPKKNYLFEEDGPGGKPPPKEKKEKSHNGKTDNGKKDKKKPKESKGGKSSSGPTRRHSPNSGGHEMYTLPQTDLRAAQAKALGGPAVLTIASDGISKKGSKEQKKEEKTKAERNHMGWWVWLKLLAGIIFVAGYAVGVAYMTFEVVKARASAEKGDDVPSCKRLQCPSDSVCVDLSGKGHASCSETTYQNLQILQLVLGIIVGVPAVVCLPCTVQWLVRTGGPWLCAKYTAKRRKMRVGGVARASSRASLSSRDVLDTESPRADEDLEPGELSELTKKRASRKNSGLCTLFGCCRRKPEAEDLPAHPAEAPDADDDEPDLEEGEEGEVAEDDMDVFFASIPKKKGKAAESPAKPAEDDFLDSIFASRRMDTAPPAMPQADDGLDMNEDLHDDDPGLDVLFAKPKVIAKAKGASPAKGRGGDIVPDEENFDDFFHRPAGRPPGKGGLPPVPTAAPGRQGAALPPMPSSAPARGKATDEQTDFSAGLSAIFAATKAGPASRVSAARSRSNVADSTASSAQESEADSEEYADSEDYGEAPDFIGFALGIARGQARVDEDDSVAGGTDIYSAAGAGGWDDARSDTSGGSGVDSLAGLEPSLFTELFHPPL